MHATGTFDAGMRLARLAGLLAASASAWLTAAGAQADGIPGVVAPALATEANTPEGFLPKGWRIEHALRGRVDDDAREDAVLVLRMDDPANVLAAGTFASQAFDTNPRLLLVALAQPGGGWRRVVANDALVPRPESPYADDYLGDDVAASVTLRDRVLRVRLHLFMSAGGWNAGTTDFKFRWQDGCLRLIGLEEDDTHRGSGETSELSIDFLSGRAWRRTGSIEDEAPGLKRWTRLASTAPVCIEAVGDDFAFSPSLVDDAR